MATKDLEQYERSYCDCEKCEAACRHMPGMLAPGDLPKIADYCGVDQSDSEQYTKLLESFRASEGAMVKLKNGKWQRIPTIVPAQKEGDDTDGSCVFFSEEHGCSLHKVAPFGCRNFNVCAGEESKEEYDAMSAHCLWECSRNTDYLLSWNYLKEQNLEAPPLKERRQKLSAHLNIIETREGE